MPVTVERDPSPVKKILATCSVTAGDRIRVVPFSGSIPSDPRVQVVINDCQAVVLNEAIEFFTACLEMAKQQAAK